MVLLDSERTQVDANGAYLKLLGFPRDQLLGRPIYEFNTGERVSPTDWQEMLRSGHATGEATMSTAEGGAVAVQWAASAETVTGRRLVLLVALSTSRWGRRFRRTPATGAEPGRLSERERTVVRLVALGNTGPEIAEELGIAHDTVRTHVRNAMTKVDARSRAHLVAKALGDGRVLGDGAP